MTIKGFAALLCSVCCMWGGFAFADPPPSYYNESSTWRLMELESAELEGWKLGYLRDPYMEEYETKSGDEEWKGGVGVKFDVTLVEWKPNWRLYWKNKVHTDGTQRQVRHVGWWWDAGMSVGEKVDLFYEHHSRHCMECNVDGNFPLRDAYGVRFKLYRRNK